MNDGNDGSNAGNAGASSVSNAVSRGYPKPYGRYILEERIAMGGMAEIFRAKTATAGFEKRVCIKRVLPHFLEDEEFVTMFRDEARTAAKLQHANVVQVFDFGEEDGALYLAMELVDGNDLRRIMESSRKKRVPIHVGEAVQIAIDMCRGLHHAHGLGVVHRDVSPHNVLVSKVGEVKVTDFGIARAAERATHTSTGIVKGKVAYMSPEQAQGHSFDHRLDQFATGIVLWEMLTGTRLFTGESDVFILKKVLACDIPTPSSFRKDVPPALDDIVLKALSRYADDRYRDMRAMELALQRFLFSGAVDPATAEVRNVFARIMQAKDLALRKTQIADAAEIAAASAAQDASTAPPSAPNTPNTPNTPNAPNAPSPAAGSPNMTSNASSSSSSSSSDMSKTKTDSQPNVSVGVGVGIGVGVNVNVNAEAAGRASEAARDGVSPTGPEISNVFSSSDKLPRASMPAAPERVRSGRPRAPVEVDPNALTVMEVNEADIPSPADPVLSPVSSGKHARAPSSQAQTQSDAALPSVDDLRRLDEASLALALAPAPDATPATRTNVPKGAPSTTAPGTAASMSPNNAAVHARDDAIDEMPDAPRRPGLPIAAGAMLGVVAVVGIAYAAFIIDERRVSASASASTPTAVAEKRGVERASAIPPAPPPNPVVPVVPVNPVVPATPTVSVEKAPAVERPRAQKVKVSLRTKKGWFISPALGEVSQEPTMHELPIGKRSYKVKWGGEREDTITLDLKADKQRLVIEEK